MASPQKLSDDLFSAAMSPGAPTTVSRQRESRLKNRREALLGTLRKAIAKDGKYLYVRDSFSHAREAAFSKHGSIYLRLHLREINDIDVYVILDGSGMTYGGTPLEGSTHIGEVNPNIRAFAISPMNPELGDSVRAEQWMIRMVQASIPSNARHKVKISGTPGRRGVTLAKFGTRPKATFDIIPAFLMKKADGSSVHVIPSGGGWETNPTPALMQTVEELHEEYYRDDRNKLLGFKDMVKLFKVIKKKYSWGSKHGITSFVILNAVTSVLQQMSHRHLNQERINMVVSTLNEWVRQKAIRDPGTGGKHLRFKGGSVQWNDAMLHDVFQTLKSGSE